MNDVFVTAINNPEIKRGMGSNGKPWSQAHVQLNNGLGAYIFNPIAIGDKVESVKRAGKDGKEYTNWVKVRPEKEDVAILKQILTKVNQIAIQVGVVEEPHVEAVPGVVNGQITDDGRIEFPPDFLG